VIRVATRDGLYEPGRSGRHFQRALMGKEIWQPDITLRLI
jgi:hypothetical protein